MSAELKGNFHLEIANVLFMDVVGYTKLLTNEQCELLQELNQVVRDSTHFRRAEAAGELIRLPTGDGMALIFFRNAEAPVECALEISRALRRSPQLRVRMGIHSGPVNQITDVNDRSNVAGAGINIAQRVMDCGDAGHILLSKRVAEDLAQYRQWAPCLHDLGELEVKHGVKLALVNLYTEEVGNPDLPEKFKQGDSRQAAGPIVSDKSIAVLPFVDLSQAKDQEYFCDGISEEILGVLAKVEGLRVAARTSSFSFKGKNIEVSEVAKKLNVENVLEGSLRRDGNRIRIAVQLINGRDGFHRWSETYERELQGVFAVQDEITRAIVDALKIQLTAALPAQPQRNTESYELYLKGRFHWNKRTAEALKKAIEYFKRAIEKEPDYALAYTGLADCYSSLVFSFDAGSLSPRAAIPKAKEAVKKASEINDNLAETHTSLAFIKLNYDWDWSGAEREFKRAIQLNPNYENAHHWYSHYLLATGRTDESLAESHRALELDRVGLVMNLHLGWHYLYARQYDLAIEQFQRTLELDDSYGQAHWYLGQAYGRKAMYQEALAELNKADDILKQNVGARAEIGRIYAISGKRSAAQRIIKELKQLSARKYVSSYHVALIHAGLREKDRAFECLDNACKERSDLLVYLKIDPRLDDLRADPRFSGLLRRIGVDANVSENHSLSD
jgi:TolB-like protein/Tfp pilus assembly protein PilF